MEVTEYSRKLNIRTQKMKK